MPNKPRKPWLAGALSLITFGLGHLYSGEAKKGFLLYLIGHGIMLAVLFLYAWMSPKIFNLLIAVLFAVLLIFGVLIYSLVDAIRISRKHSDKYELKRYNRWYIYLLVFAVTSFLIDPLFENVIKGSAVQGYSIPSGAMKPTLQNGDYILADKRIYKNSDPKRGDIIIFPYPKNPSKDYLKRVVAVGGETIRIINKRIYINGELLEEPFTTIYTDNKSIDIRGNYGPQKIPDDSLFVMGDNRDNSSDSRFWGFVKTDSVKGKAVSIYWSWDKENDAVRWERIGKEIQ